MSQYNQTWGSVISCSMATSYSGSFEKLYICKSGIIDRIEFGEPKVGIRTQTSQTGSIFTPKGITGLVSASAGSYIEGPIGRFKTHSTMDGAWILAYKR